MKEIIRKGWQKMIQKATDSELGRIKNVFDFVYSSAYSNFWFKEQYQKEEMYLYKENVSILTLITAKHHAMQMKDYKLGYTYLSHFWLDPSMQNRKDFFVSEIAEDVSYQNLILVVPYSENLDWKRLGFEPFVKSNRYIITRADIPTYSSSGIADSFSNEELLSAYRNYTSFFEGYEIRNLEYYHKKQEYNRYQGYTTLVYRNKSGEIAGYVIFDTTVYPIQIKEIIYLNSTALSKLLSAVLNYKDSLTMSLTRAENVQAFLGNASCESEIQLMAKITDYELFNRLYNTEVSSLNEFAAKLEKPFYNNELF